MKKQELIIILISTLICVIAWIGFNLYHSSITSTISPAEIVQITPIDPNFNTQVIAELKKRETVEPVFQATPSSSLKPYPTPTIVIKIPITGSGSAQTTTGGQINHAP